MASTKNSILDQLVCASDNCKFLSNKRFLAESYNDFRVSPKNGQLAIFENVGFIDCEVKRSPVEIRKNTRLTNVEFINLKCKDAIFISSEVELNNLRISNENPDSRLFIKPQTRSASQRANEYRSGKNNSVSLDISSFFGEVSIVGIKASRILTRGDEHVIINVNRLRKVEWDKLSVGPLCYWKIMAKKVHASHSLEGIFSIPREASKSFRSSRKELEILRSEGFIE